MIRSFMAAASQPAPPPFFIVAALQTAEAVWLLLKSYRVLISGLGARAGLALMDRVAKQPPAVGQPVYQVTPYSH